MRITEDKTGFWCEECDEHREDVYFLKFQEGSIIVLCVKCLADARDRLNEIVAGWSK